MYITKEAYQALYGQIDSQDFDRLAFRACRTVDRYTTGVDGVKKLKVAFPTDDDSKEAVTQCAAALVSFFLQIQDAEKSASMGRGFVEDENGVHGRMVSSVTSGAESVSYSTIQHQKSTIDTAASDMSVRDYAVRGIIKEYLSNVKDANGVNLLYMGVYPRV